MPRTNAVLVAALSSAASLAMFWLTRPPALAQPVYTVSDTADPSPTPESVPASDRTLGGSTLLHRQRLVSESGV